MRLQDRIIMPPLWLAFPEIQRYSIGWRMGYGEDYRDRFWNWMETFSIIYCSIQQYLRTTTQNSSIHHWLRHVCVETAGFFALDGRPCPCGGQPLRYDLGNRAFYEGPGPF